MGGMRPAGAATGSGDWERAVKLAAERAEGAQVLSAVVRHHLPEEKGRRKKIVRGACRGRSGSLWSRLPLPEGKRCRKIKHGAWDIERMGHQTHGTSIIE